MILNTTTWEYYFKNQSITRCSIADNNTLFFILTEKPNPKDPDTHPPTRFLYIDLNKPELERIDETTIEGLRFCRSATRKLHNGSYEFVAVDMSGYVYVKNDSHDDMEEPDLSESTAWTCTDGTNYSSSPLVNVKRLINDIYVVGRDHRVIRRADTCTWIHSPGLERPHSNKSKTNSNYNRLIYGFTDISCFQNGTTYAGGGHGDLWCFEGNKWHHCDFPTNDSIQTICCSQDGNVYITTGHENGCLWVGKKDTWKELIQNKIIKNFKTSVCFANKIWFGGDHGLWVLEKDKLQKIAFPNEIFGRGMMSGQLDTSIDGKYLLTSGIHGAALFDGKSWEPLFNISFFEPDFDKGEDEE